MTGPTTYQVRMWALKQMKGRRRPWGVRWVTAGQEHSEWFTTKALAESFRGDLVKAQRAGEPFDVESGLPTSLIRPYDLRHAAVSTWLNAGVPPTEIAQLAGHSLAVLLSVYAKCMDGERDTYNARISAALGE